VRFPYGAGAEDPAVRAAVAAWRPDTVAVQWSLCAQEWEFIDGCPTPEAARAATADAVRRLAATEDWDRAIILMHDWPNAAAFCAGLLDAFLAEIARRGLSPVVLSDTLGPPIRGTGECNCRP
jgi:peptidoglycan/xylan/chitin deacetylase (PgdA/CDA1 family)